MQNQINEYITQMNDSFMVELSDGYVFIDSNLKELKEQLDTYNEWELERLESFQGILDDFDSLVVYEDGVYNAETSDGFYLEETSIAALTDAIEDYISMSQERVDEIEVIRKESFIYE